MSHGSGSWAGADHTAFVNPVKKLIKERFLVKALRLKTELWDKHHLMNTGKLLLREKNSGLFSGFSLKW